MAKRASAARSRMSDAAELVRPGWTGLRVSRLPGGKGLAVAGEVDMATHRNWRTAATWLLDTGTHTRLDLSGLTFIDGHGAAVLVTVAQKMAPSRTLTLYRPPLCLRRLLDLFWPDGIQITIEDEEAG